MFFLPVVTTTAIVGVVMQFILDPASGPINAILMFLGFEGGVNFLGDSRLALPTVAVVYVWKFFGITMIYWLAALQTIPQEIYEAAKIDGAGSVQIFWHITVPLLKPFLIIISLLTIEDTFRAFDLMQTMTAGGPFFSTEIIEIYIYRWAFAASIPQLGHASAAAVLFGAFVFVVGLIQLWGVFAARRIEKGLRGMMRHSQPHRATCRRTSMAGEGLPTGALVARRRLSRRSRDPLDLSRSSGWCRPR